MNILVTLDANYIRPLKVMLKSLFINNPEEQFNIYLMHSSIKEQELSDIKQFVTKHEHQLFVITIGDQYFNDAPIIKHYTKEMYYRLLAFKFLPESLDKILYLDPDILVINKISQLYHTDISNSLYAAAFHKISVKEINKLRLFPYEIEEYFNSGVLLMNLTLQRKKINEQQIYEFVDKNKNRLILPDQDVINALYSKDIRQVDEILYNYDPRYYWYYKISSKGIIDMDYVINHTAIIHFCGKRKPWKQNYTGKFHSLYKHYEKLALQ
ncbi:glycosyltransferase family 8 protein [Peptococcaceae bacterium 1198_IL3148]